MLGLIGAVARTTVGWTSASVTRGATLMRPGQSPASRLDVEGQFALRAFAAPMSRWGNSNWQVHHDAEGVVAVAGRIDNMPDLCRRLGMRLPPETATAHAVRMLLHRQGVAGLAHVVGDFALMLWEARLRRLVLACDAMGRHPLYYRQTSEEVVWCTESRPLLLRSPSAADLDETFLADFITNRMSRCSPYRGVEMLAGGEALVVDPSGDHRVRYWQLDATTEIRYADDADYAAHFRELFKEAVRCRIAGHGTVFSELSGGLDSSSIACVASELLGLSGTLHTITCVYPDAPSADERVFSDVVASGLSGDNIQLAAGDYPYLDMRRFARLPDYPTRQILRLPLADRIAELMASRGATVLLSGIGGDQLLNGEAGPAVLADQIAMRQWNRLASTCLSCSVRLRWPLWKTAWLGAIVPLKRAWIGPLVSEAPGAWFDRRFVRRTHLATRLSLDDDVIFRVPSRSLQWALLRHSMRPFALDRVTSTGLVDTRYPFLDRRLVEFVLAIPVEQLARDGERRSLMRRSLRGIVPKAVLERRSKAGPGESFLRSLRAAWPWLCKVVESPILEELGIVDATSFRHELAIAMHGHCSNEAQLTTTVALELWLRGLGNDHSAASAPDNGAVGVWTNGTVLV